RFPLQRQCATVRKFSDRLLVTGAYDAHSNCSRPVEAADHDTAREVVAVVDVPRSALNQRTGRGFVLRYKDLGGATLGMVFPYELQNVTRLCVVAEAVRFSGSVARIGAWAKVGTWAS